MKNLVSISEAARLLGVCCDTLRGWGNIVPIRTPGKHRRYKLADIEKLTGDYKPVDNTNRCAIYARVSSHDQKKKGDLGRQSKRLVGEAAGRGYILVKVFEEVGSGMSDSRSKLRQLFRLVENQQINKVLIEHKDRLSRFNFKFLVEYFHSHSVEIEWVDDVLGKSYEQELVEDMLSLIATFSARIYGKRAAENKKKHGNNSRLQNGTQAEQQAANFAA